MTQTTTDTETDDPQRIDWTDLSAFQRDCILTIADLEQSGTDRAAVYGLAVKDALEERRDEEVNHGRLYPNLDDLVDAGLVEKDALDKRTNSYAISDAGQSMLEWAAAEIANAAGYRLHEDHGDREVLEADD